MSNIISKQRNVTLEQRNVSKESYFPCPICENMLKIKMTKKKKPYLVCNDCGMQMFIRDEKGIKRVNKMSYIKVD